ncbi:MAG: NADH-quinone oxidoreductase subunit C [Candidatus Marinimicrobia bacterium]|nr:NADH-quinone oxidoreductase subunit C [Candidatus Neomarinimicrobiota bacterium]MBT3632268.1 NADH-quinone oxidoreductase subunit C [Candidatus Neomarinimicrobiota bacterium]MBT3825924.1 NADH-quinone oxidoreductase subunit C [Candidatus Neomarinimicrobiota bacterium]MBT4129670.1 NADH-quinone oxidoreductase subunit C [Candidatus Neomarinimicrobiota bacterium]MBT4294435.1 NADH-quinone oxidoreductase subunit C [Candidatus Neomarinimicrobiota bacterium]
MEEGTLNPTVVVDAAAIAKIVTYLKDDERFQFDSLMNLAGHDGDVEADLSVIYHLVSTELKHYITLKVFTSRVEPKVASVAVIYRTANWHEREAFDLYGINFEGHPDLKRILLEDDWEGYPLRKDYVPAEFYRGMRIEKVK